MIARNKECISMDTTGYAVYTVGMIEIGQSARETTEGARMRTITNSEANRRCDSGNCNMVGQILIDSDGRQPLAVEDTLEQAIAAAIRLGCEITADDVRTDDGSGTSDDLFAYRIIEG